MWFGLVYCPWQPEADKKWMKILLFFYYSMFKFRHIISSCLVATCFFCHLISEVLAFVLGFNFFVTFAQSTLVALVIGEECRGHGGDVRHVKEGTGWTEASPRIHRRRVGDTADGSEIRRSPVEVGSLWPIMYKVSKTSKRWLALGFLNHQPV